ncbi:hypothetical protein HGRIS_014048 [Hohenbuehelia grisea]|uniref:Uncharacterized protein n=1 Tax=Hohenbuehelia grisea TaxID=104357 RepID=A0ABR3JTV2_9AGAR
MKTLSVALIAFVCFSTLVTGSPASIEFLDESTFKFDGHVVTTRVKPASPTLLAFHRSQARSEPRALFARVPPNNACEFGCTIETCTNDLSSSPDPPLEADCTALRDAIQALAIKEVKANPSCVFVGNPNCPSFTVNPEFERLFSLGTCLRGFINLEPVGGPPLSYCTGLMFSGLTSAYTRCITNAGNTGGFCTDQQTSAFYALELRHV